VTSRPVLGVVAPEFAHSVEAALRESGADALADQIPDLRVASLCDCAPSCSAFLSVPLHERGEGRLRTMPVLHTGEMTVLVDAVDGVIVGLDVLDAGELRAAVEGFGQPS
jgi:hypothetical protein